MRWRPIQLLALVGLCGCNDAGGKGTGASDVGHAEGAIAASSAAKAAPSGPPSALATPAPWYVGTWEGTYEVQRHRVERPSVQIAWMRDDGTRFAGGGKLALVADEAGRLRGTASGALGEQSVSGLVDGEALGFELEGPTTRDGIHGVVQCRLSGSTAVPAASSQVPGAPPAAPEARTGSGGASLSCSVSAATGDGNFVRAGTANLRQVPASLP
jgi:hypothetical protein